MKATDTWDPDPYGAPRVKRSKGGKHKARRTRELQRLLATAIVKFAGHPHSCSRHDTSTWACDCGFVEWLRQAMRELGQELDNVRAELEAQRAGGAR